MCNDNLVSVSDYFCNPDVCKHCYAQALDSIKMAEAFVDVGGKQFVDFAKYDFFIAEFLEGLLEKVKSSSSPGDAYEYVSNATGLFDTRNDFMNYLGVELSEAGSNQADELQRMFNLAFSGFQLLVDHLACAHELLFRANQNAFGDKEIQGSNKHEIDIG